MAARKKAAAKPLFVEKAAPATMDTSTTKPDKDWRDPDVTFAEDDNSLQAQMWRLYQHQRNATGN